MHHWITAKCAKVRVLHLAINQESRKLVVNKEKKKKKKKKAEK